jgi:hypothetical protein
MQFDTAVNVPERTPAFGSNDPVVVYVHCVPLG